MKQKFTIIIFLMIQISLYSQNIGLNSDGSVPDPSAMLDIKSGISGFLIPRMTKVQRTELPSPATGLLVYQTDQTPGFYYFNGAGWVTITNGYVETDPLFSTSTSSGITGSQISTWNTAFGWGQKWSFTGTSGTNPATNFLGTTDARGISLRSDNNENFVITATGNAGTGTSAPTQKLQVNGSIGIRESTNSGNRFEMHLNRGRINFSSIANDNNHVIYNNVYNIDNEGAWDGIKMNVFEGLNIRSGTSTNTSAWFIDNYGNTGIGSELPQKRLEVSSQESSWISGTFAGTGGNDKIVLGNLNDLATLGAHNADFTAWTSLNLNTDGVSGGGDLIMGFNSGIGMGTSAPDASAALEVNSTTKGMLIPRMTMAQRNLIAEPVASLLIYQTDGTSGFYYHNGTSWHYVDEFQAETDPVYAASPSSTISEGDIVNWIETFGWGNHASAGYLTGVSETDPVFASAPAKNISLTNVSNWNSAYGWGNHALAGYIKSYTETDPVFNAAPAAGIQNLNITNWNTAYSWGHSWSLSGNPGTSPSSDFIGTSNNAGFVFRTNNIERLRISADGNVGIATGYNPGYKLDVQGNLIIKASTGNTDKYDINLNRGRLKFSSENDNNHLIYNNFKNIDGEGVWDGIKMNVYNGLNVRVGLNGSTSALYINSGGNVGIGTTDPRNRLEVSAGDSWISASFSGTGGSDKVVLGNIYGYATIGAHSSDFSEWKPLMLNCVTGGAGGNVIMGINSSVGIGTSTPDASAILEISSNSHGFLLPRMTRAQRLLIGMPATGLMVYQTDEQPGFYFYTGAAWNRFGAITETDPVFLASAAHNISNDDINHWNSSYSWGNHATAGYITSVSESDPAYESSVSNGISNTDVDHWNEAYGWGASWPLSGISGTNPNLNFIGTTDNTDLAIRTNNTERIRFTSGYVGIGTSSPTQALQVEGNIAIKTSVNSTERYEIQIPRGILSFSETANSVNNLIFNNALNLDGQGAWDGLKMNVMSGLNVRVGANGATSALYITGLPVKVGIGTTSPVDKLDVRGNVKIAASTSSSNKYDVNVNRNRLKFSPESDFNHVIYNNINNIDGEGSWDGTKMNVGQGLNVRVGANGATSALYINQNGQVNAGPDQSLASLSTGSNLAIVETGSSPVYSTILQSSDLASSSNEYILPTALSAASQPLLGHTPGDANSGRLSWSSVNFAETQNIASALTYGANAGNQNMVNLSQIGIGTSTPNTSAAIEISSTDKGFLLPRLTKEQILNLPNPAEGLIVFNTSDKKPYIWNGSSWRHNNSSLVIQMGEFYCGGYVFYLDGTGHHGLTCSPDFIAYVPWGNNSIWVPTGTAFGTGYSNTVAIVNANGNSFNYAAKSCYDLILNGYDDWYLPSRDELTQIGNALYKSGIGNFGSKNIWTSSGDPYPLLAKYIAFLSTSFYYGTEDKAYNMFVLAIRSF